MERKIAFINVCTTNLYDPMFFDSLNSVLLEWTEFHLGIGTDMNAILDMRDKSNKTNLKSPIHQGSLAYTLITTSLMPGNPEAKQYTFYSNRHKSFSLIDVILSTPIFFHQEHLN